MSFDPNNTDTSPVSPKTYPLSIVTYDLMCLVMESDDIPRAANYIEEIVENLPNIDKTLKVPPEAIWELKEIEKEILERKLKYRKDSEEYSAKIYASKFQLLSNWIIFFIAIFYLTSYARHESDVDTRILQANVALLLVSFSIFFITWISWFQYTPLEDDETPKLNKHYERLKTELKPVYSVAELVKEQKNVIDLFSNDFLTERRRYLELVARRYDLKGKTAIPIFLYMLCVFVFFLVKGVMNEGKERKFGFLAAFSTFSIAFPLLIPTLITF